MSKQSWLFALALAFVGALLASASIEGGVLDASWTAATTSTDGSALTSVALYRLYYGDSHPTHRAQAAPSLKSRVPPRPCNRMTRSASSSRV